jgi:cell division protein ZipA|tara:strand:+ start:2327 stop:3178 length:852 start_codon:yes stop_codon:yes gene_type:complete
MDFFGPREILILVAVLALVAVVLDGARRIKRNRYENLQMSSRKMKQFADSNEFDDDDVLDHSQFPSGGSRVVGARSADDLGTASEASADNGEFSFSKQPEQQGFDLDHSIFASRDDELDDLEAPVAVPEPEPVKPPSTESPQDVLVMHLMANKGEMLNGGDLLEASVEVGLRYGAMKIFHRHLKDDGSGAVLFSMANLLNPGTFDLNTMAKITTPGVTLFMALDDIDDPSGAFEIMIEAVNTMAEKLPLNVMDESRSSMTAQTIDHYRQRAKKAALQQSNDYQ